MVLAIIAVIALVVIGLIGWCIWRFCKKKRPKGAEDKKAAGEEDENALVDNEDVNIEEVCTIKHHQLKCFSNRTWAD